MDVVWTVSGQSLETVHFRMISRSYVISGPYNRQGYTNTSHSREDALVQEDVAPIRVGLLGAGTVGSQTARLLVEQKDELAARIGRPIELTGVACLDPSETDPFPWIDKSVVTTDTMSVATNADIVVELIGGTGVARKFVLAAIESGASVVTANKAAIMATLGFHTNVTIDDVSVEGITKITADDIAAATAENKVIKLLAVVENGEAGVSARVYPALISNEHPLASVHGSFNAVFVKAEAADDLMFYGRGAGGAPTASAVVGDVVTEARHIAQGCTGPTIPLYKDLKKAPIEASKAEFAVRFVIHDNPGVLAAIAAKFAEHGVSINGVNQDLKPTLKDPGYDGELQQLRLVTHMTDELTLRETVKDVCALDCVVGEPSILRVLN